MNNYDTIGELYNKKLNYCLSEEELHASERDEQWIFIKKCIIDSKIGKDAVILDAGCGNGKYSILLKRMGYKNVVSMDLFSEHNEKQLHYVQGTVDKIPFEDGSFDVIIAASVIYYLKNPEDAIGEFSRCLKDGGIVFVSVVTKYSLYAVNRILRKKLRFKSANHIETWHFKNSIAQYVSMFKRDGFNIILVDGFFKPTIFWFIIRKMVFLVSGITLERKIISNNAVKAKIKSYAGYHAVIIAKKDKL